MQHTDDKQPATHSQIVLTTNKTLFSPCLSLSHVQVAVQMRRACPVDPVCVTLCCHGNTLFSHTPDPPFSVLHHPLASDPHAHCCPINSLFFFLLPSLALAVTVLRPGSVLGCPAPCWPTLWGRRRWTGHCATGCDSQQGTELHEHFLLIHLKLYKVWPKTQGHFQAEFRSSTIFIYLVLIDCEILWFMIILILPCVMPYNFTFTFTDIAFLIQFSFYMYALGHLV